MNPNFPRFRAMLLASLTLGLLCMSADLIAADGKKWDGGRYPFKLLNPSQPNSESNPFIIDTAGKLAYFAWLAKADQDMVAYGKKNGLTGLRHSFKDNYVKLTADLDMNGSRYEFQAITESWVNFDGGGHVIDNLWMSDRTTPPFINSDTGDAEMHLALFESAESIKNLSIGKGSRITYSGVSRLTLITYIAGIALEAYRMENCSSAATISVRGNGEALIGGLANSVTYLSNSHHRGTISFTGNVINSRAKNRGKPVYPSWFKMGGVCTVSGKTISGCSNTGSLTVNASGESIMIGGVIGETNRSVCTDLFNTGGIRLNATGDIKYAEIGGVIGRGMPYPSNPQFRTTGYADSGYIYNTGTVTATVTTGKKIFVGGVGGGLQDQHGTLTSVEFTGVNGYLNAYNTGTVSATATGVSEVSAGGITGGGVMIFNCYNTGGITGASVAGGQANVGGLGGANVYVQNSYNRGPVVGTGTGTNYVGGIMGFADMKWGEVDRQWYTAHNAFWLKAAKAGGVNSTIRYATGSYFYLRQGDIKKEALGQLLDALDKTDPNTMVEDHHRGFFYTFDTPTATIMRRSDDGPGKRPDRNGTLLANLNDMVEDKIDRRYRRWITNGSNDGYPVLSSTPTEYSKTPSKPDAETARKIAGTYAAVHHKWSDTVIIKADGTFKRATGSDGGSWSFNGKRLTLSWTKWDPEILALTATGAFSSNSYTFTLTRSDAASTGTVATDSGSTVTANGTDSNEKKPDAPNARLVAGIYYVNHKDWTGVLIIKADGTFIREGSTEKGTWVSDGRTLTLNWIGKPAEKLFRSSTGFSCLTYKFTMRLR